MIRGFAVQYEKRLILQINLYEKILIKLNLAYEKNNWLIRRKRGWEWRDWRESKNEKKEWWELMGILKAIKAFWSRQYWSDENLKTKTYFSEGTGFEISWFFMIKRGKLKIILKIRLLLRAPYGENVLRRKSYDQILNKVVDRKMYGKHAISLLLVKYVSNWKF